MENLIADLEGLVIRLMEDNLYNDACSILETLGVITRLPKKYEKVENN